MSRVEESADTPWISKTTTHFNLYMGDLYNALQSGKVKNINFCETNCVKV